MVSRRSLATQALMAAVLTVGLVAACSPAATHVSPIRIGLVAPMSGPSGASGEAIERGMLLAMDEVNAAGGVLGRPLELVTRDVQNDGEAGVAALREMAATDGIVAVFGGLYSPVMLAQLDLVHELQLPLIDAWGSVTRITKNGRDPNYAFRVSLSDETADEFLARYAVTVTGVRRPGILADSTAWGDSNVAGLQAWLDQLGVVTAAIERFDQGETDMTRQAEQLRAAGADGVILIANAPEGAAIVRGMETMGWSVPVVSHWGISGGQFVRAAGSDASEGVLTVQTFSFAASASPVAERVASAYLARFGGSDAASIAAPVGVAHGYDGVRLLAMAIAAAGTTDGPAVRAALEAIGTYDGLVARYDRPFGPGDHEALEAADHLMTVWQDGRLVPADPARLP